MVNQIQNLLEAVPASPAEVLAGQIQNLDANLQGIYESIQHFSNYPQNLEQLVTERQDLFEQHVQHQVSLGAVGGLDQQPQPPLQPAQWQQPIQPQQHTVS